MKTLIHKILFSLSAILLLGGCSDELVYNNMDSLKGRIVIDFSSGLDFESRTVDDTDVERYLSHLDIMIFNANGTLNFHQRVENPMQEGDDSKGKVALTKSRDQFEQNQSYNVYVVANSTLADSEFSAPNLTLDALKNKLQTDVNLHLTGIYHGVSNQAAETDIPDYFLMDGNISDVLLYTGSETAQTTTLSVTLKRAASKIVVVCKPKKDSGISFDRTLPGKYDDIIVKDPMYRVRNLPTQTKILAGNYTKTEIDNSLKNTASTWGKYYQWKEDGSVEVTLYVYEHSWNTEDNFLHGTNLVLNIPMKIAKDGEDEQDDEYPSNYYQIPLAQPVQVGDEYMCSFERNQYYKIVAEIGAPGAINLEDPVTLEALKFTTMPWTPKSINVSGSNASYLEVTPTLVEMHNVAVDANTVKFSSSSPVTVEVVNTKNDYPYYYDKYGRKVKVSFQSEVEEDKISISSVADAGTSGNITINSSVPKNFTARYFTLKITNEDGKTETVNVIQYPVICVSNQLSYYSYRDDFTNNDNGIMTYVNCYSGGKVNVSVDVNDNGWELDYGTGSSGGFFASKVRGDANNDGTYENLRYYYYNGDRWNNSGIATSQTESNANIRMYKIDVKATSNEYVVGKPRITDGITDPSWDNQRMVSPSFMIASRLAIITSNGGNLGDLDDGCSSNERGGVKFDKTNSKVVVGKVSIETDRNGNLTSHTWSDSPDAYNVNEDQLLEVYADHCKKYVEVDNDGNEYNDWRLPTAAEIQFIVDTQGTGTNSEAIDYLLNGLFYYSACGPVYNINPSSSGKTIRCVRDVY